MGGTLERHWSPQRRVGGGGSCGQEPLSWFLWEGMAEAGWAGVSWLVRIILVGSGGIQALPGGLVSGPMVFRAGG